MKKYITRIYRNDSIDSIEKADQEHMRLIKLFDIFFLASTKGSSIKFSKIIAKSRE